MTYDRIIMFCDFGLDDAVALMHILDEAEYNELDIVPIGGNVRAEVAHKNAHTLLAAYAADRALHGVVRVVDTRAVAQAAADIPDIHGRDGIGDVLPARDSGVEEVVFGDFAREIRESARPDRDCVLSLGPCTLPDMLDYAPFCTILMGGTTKEPPNYGSYEFNEGMDPAAFCRFAKKAAAVATLDTCHRATIDYASVQKGREPGARLVQKYLRLCADRSAPPTIYDYVAALAVTHPHLFTATPVTRPDGVQYAELEYAEQCSAVNK